MERAEAKMRRSLYCFLSKSNEAATLGNTALVDAFAGRGKQQLPIHVANSEDESLLATASFWQGSALRALKVSSNSSRRFDRFLFIEARRSASQQLIGNINADHPSMSERVAVLRSDANEAISAYIYQTDWSKTRRSIFLDPLGLEVSGIQLSSLLLRRHAMHGTYSPLSVLSG